MGFEPTFEDWCLNQRLRPLCHDNRRHDRGVHSFVTLSRPQIISFHYHWRDKLAYLSHRRIVIHIGPGVRLIITQQTRNVSRTHRTISKQLLQFSRNQQWLAAWMRKIEAHNIAVALYTTEYSISLTVENVIVMTSIE